MRSIDIHAHYSPRVVYDTIEAGKDWHGLTLEQTPDGREYLVRGNLRKVRKPKATWNVTKRIQDMNMLGVDVHILSAQTFLYGYELPPELGALTSRDINNDIANTVKEHPDRFGGLATLPMQDVPSAIKEL